MAQTIMRGSGEDPDEFDWDEQLFADGLEFVDNPEPRSPCVLVLDTSRSMSGEPIAALNAGLLAFRDELLQSPLGRRRVEVAVVTFGATVEVAGDFVTIDGFAPPVLRAGGETPLGTGLLKALDILEARKVRYREAGVAYTRPWVFLITDGMPHGEPLDVIREAVRRVRAEEQARKVVFFAVGVEGANMKLLARLSARPPVKLSGLRFTDLFTWLSASTRRVAAAGEGDQVALPPIDWGTT